MVIGSCRVYFMSQSEDLTEILPLFPLNVVLFPQAQLPLHIYEERYKILINECIVRDNDFGINHVFEQQMKPVGCTAVVKEVLKRYDDGQLDIIVEGRRRYTLLNVIEAKRPYLCGRVTWLNDTEEFFNEPLKKLAVELYNQFVPIVFNGTVKKINGNDPRQSRSFFLVQKSGLELSQRQIFLGMVSETERLNFLIQHFESILPLLTSNKKVEELAKNDGYLQE